MTDYQNNYNETSDKVTQQAVKRTPDQWQNAYPQNAPQLGNYPENPLPSQYPITRNRRADRYDSPAARQPVPASTGRMAPVRNPSAAMSSQGPLSHVGHQPQPMEQQAIPSTPPQQDPMANGDTKMFVTPAPNYAAGQTAPAGNAYPPVPQDTHNHYVNNTISGYEEDEEDEDKIRIWPRVLLAVLGLMIALCLVLHFIPNAGPLQPVKNAIDGLLGGNVQKEQAEVLSLKADHTSLQVGDTVHFIIETNKHISELHLVNEAGQQLVAATRSEETDSTRVWHAQYTFHEAYAGKVYACYQDNDGTHREDSRSTYLHVTAPQPTPTPVPVYTQAPAQVSIPLPTQSAAPVFTPIPTPIATEIPAATATPVVTNPPIQHTAVPVIATWAPAITPMPTQAPTASPVPTTEPTQAPTATPMPTPSPSPVPTAVPVPTASPMPRLMAQGDIAFNMNDTVFIGGKEQKDYQREVGYVAPNPDEYGMITAAGVLTFRGDNFRRNAAYGTAEIENGTMSILWQSPMGSLRTEDNGTLWGTGWTGQPAIIKWSKEAREMMNLYEDKKNTSALQEVIVAGQDGKIYFVELKTGEATRDPINVGFPLKGSVAVDSVGRPMLAVGQGISKLANGKTGAIGLHIFNLIDGKPFDMINGRKNDNQKQYFTNGAFDGTPLFIRENNAMVVAGENGLLYTVDLNPDFKYPRKDNPDQQGSLDISISTTYLRTKAGEEKDAQVPVESSVAMYDKYIYMADTYGVLRCVDSDKMKTVWAVDNGDNTDAAIALDMEGSQDVSLYTGNTAYSRLGSKKDVSIRKLDALTGEELWRYNIKCEYNKSQLSGVKASPIVGQHDIASLVIFTVNMVDGGGSRMVALNKKDGSLVWSHSMDADTVSSPVAVYNSAGKAWVIQADGNGILYLLDGRTGRVKSTLALGGKVEGSPAVYNDILVIGTCSKDAQLYGIRLQ